MANGAEFVVHVDGAFDADIERAFAQESRPGLLALDPLYTDDFLADGQNCPAVVVHEFQMPGAKKRLRAVYESAAVMFANDGALVIQAVQGFLDGSEACGQDLGHVGFRR